jgi:type IV pilus assembly protein PilM
MAFNFLSFLNPPEFLEIPSVGIDIGDSCIRFIEAKKIGGKTTIGRFGEISIPAGVFNCGDILNQDALVSVLSSLKQKYNLNFVRVSIPEEKSYIFNTEIPNVNDKEMRSVVEFSLEEFVPLKANEASFEFVPIRETPNGNIEVSVSVVPTQIIDSYIDTFKKAGMEILSFCNESRKVARAIISDEDQASYMIVNIKEKNTILSIIENGTVVFTATVAVGTEALVGKIKDAGFSTKSEGCFKIPESAFSNEEEDTSEYLYILANIFSVIRDEILTFLQFWQNKDKSKISPHVLKKIILCGRTSLVPGFAKYISSSINTDVEVANVWTNLLSLEEEVPKISFPDSLDFASSIGLVLPDNSN